MKSKYGTKWSRTGRWTPEEDEILWEAYEAGASYKYLMWLLDRGYAGITTRIRKLRRENA